MQLTTILNIKKMRSHAKENDARPDFHQNWYQLQIQWGIPSRQRARNTRRHSVYRHKSKIAIRRSIIVLPWVSRDVRFPKPAILRAKEKKTKCERTLKLHEVRRKTREEGAKDRDITCIRCVWCVCARARVRVRTWRRECMYLCRTKGRSRTEGRARRERGMGSVLITSTDFNGGFLYAVYFVHDLYYFEPRRSSARSIW